MNQPKARLYFLDAIRAWAILMMLQGHFIDGLLENTFRNDSNLLFSTWKYFRGITAPVFFTVSGFIFTFLLIKSPQTGWDNPRVKKGIRRGIELLVIGYLLRMNLFGLLKGEVYDSFYLVDVLHCIGVSLLAIVGVYLLTVKKAKWIFPSLLIAITMVLFLFEPLYKPSTFEFLPQFIANYFSKANGSVFTIIPWLGYATCGSFMSILFTRFQNHKHLYRHLIPVCLLTGASLIYFSSDVFYSMFELTGIPLFQAIFDNNYLFIRLGDVLIVFSIFMLFRNWFMHNLILKLGQSTLTIYIVHFIILYGSFTGLGLYGFFHHSVNPWVIVPGAILFMVLCTYISLRYEHHKVEIKSGVVTTITTARLYAERAFFIFVEVLRNLVEKVLQVFGLIKN